MFTIRWFVFPHAGGFWSLTLQPVGAELCHRCSQSGDICVQTADEGLYHRSAQSCDICMFPGAGRCWSLTLQTANEGLYHRSAQSCDICVFPGAGRSWSLTLQPSGAGLYHRHSWPCVASFFIRPLPDRGHAASWAHRITGDLLCLASFLTGHKTQLLISCFLFPLTHSFLPVLLHVELFCLPL